MRHVRGVHRLRTAGISGNEIGRRLNLVPPRPRQPRDKAKVEAAVLIIERWLLCRLRHRRFYRLAELNSTIIELLRQLNDERPIRRLGVTRRALLEELDRPNLKRLPAET
jgi:hypothetical protein